MVGAQRNGVWICLSYYYLPSESVHTAVRGQLSAAQSVTRANTTNHCYGQYPYGAISTECAVGKWHYSWQSPAVGVSVNISGSTDTVSSNFMSGGHHLD